MQSQFGKTLHLLILIVAVVAVAAGLFLQNKTGNNPTSLPETPSITVLPNAKPLLDTIFTDHHGNIFSTDDLKGKWSLLFFGFTNCPDVCPTTLHKLKRIKRNLQATADWQNYQVVFVSVDPKRDTTEKLNSYVPFFDKGFIGLNASETDTAAFTKQLGILYIARDADPQGNYDVDHSAGIILLNPQAKMKGVLSAPHDAKQISNDLSALARHFKTVQIDQLELVNGWIRPAAAGSNTMAAYGILENHSAEPITIDELDSPNFEMAMIHNSVIKNEMAQMQHLDEITVAANSSITLKPQSLHIMLMQPKKEYQIGDRIQLNLHTDDGTSYRQMIEVKPQPEKL